MILSCPDRGAVACNSSGCAERFHWGSPDDAAAARAEAALEGWVSLPRWGWDLCSTHANKRLPDAD